MNMRISRLNTGFAAAFLGISLLLGGCAQTEESQGAFDASPEAAGKLKVAVTLFPYYDFVRQIAGDQVDLQMVIPAGMDSHSFEPTPADIRTIQHADVLISNGGTMEHWLDENNRDAILDLYAGLAEREPLFRWSIQHSNYAYGTSDVYEYLQKARAFTIEPVAERITQDVLLLSAREDLLVDFALYKQEIDLLKNTRSLEFAVPGRALNGQAHCNMGNTRFMLDLILNWIDRTLER